MTQQDIFWSLEENRVIFMYSLHKLMYEQPGNAHCNVTATVHKSTAEHLAAGLVGR